MILTGLFYTLDMIRQMIQKMIRYVKSAIDEEIRNMGLFYNQYS